MTAGAIRSPCLECERRDDDKDCRQCASCKLRSAYADGLDPENITRSAFGQSFRGRGTNGNRNGNPKKKPDEIEIGVPMRKVARVRRKSKAKFYQEIERSIDRLNVIAYRGTI